MIIRCLSPNWDDMWLKNQKSKNVNPGKSLILSVTSPAGARDNGSVTMAASSEEEDKGGGSGGEPFGVSR